MNNTQNCLNNTTHIIRVSVMSMLMDIHALENLTEDTLNDLQQSPPGEFRVKHLRPLYNTESYLCFCFIEAPDRQALQIVHTKDPCIYLEKNEDL
jgi:hypothetical protein